MDTEGPKDFAHYYSYMWAHEYAWADWLGEGNAFKYGETEELGKQRKEILQQMEQIRAQLREQLAGVREQALQQAEQMRNRFGNNRDRVLDQGTGDGGTGHGRDR